ncbi:MAG: hypothetical protein GDA66_01650 [Nitrospira sp. CR1.2]|nr:hypothetical protein [Nitrospira sp. CR1.2]
MRERKNERKEDLRVEHQSKPRDDSEAEPPYVYRHAGIEERDGRIPVWLKLVVVGLLVWSAYYTIRYWNAS